MYRSDARSRLLKDDRESGAYSCTLPTPSRVRMILLGSGHKNLHETYQCRMYSRKLLMMGIEDARNM